MHQSHIFIIWWLLLHRVDYPCYVIDLLLDLLRLVKSLQEPLCDLIKYTFLIPIQTELHAGCLSHSLNKQGITFVKHLEFSFRVLNREDTVNIRVLSLSKLD